jgi:hypothetical protein
LRTIARGAGVAGRATDGDPLERLSAEILDTPVSGVNLMPGPLRDQLDDEAPTLLVFLRHFGCIFCRETVAELREAAGRPGFPPVIFFFQGSPTEGKAFLRRDWPDVRAVADPHARFYEAFGVGRMSPLQMLRPGLWAAERRAKAKGLEGGARSGDIWRMPGIFLVRGDRVLWQHDFRHAGDAPDFAAIPAIARSAAAAESRAPAR